MTVALEGGQMSDMNYSSMRAKATQAFSPFARHAVSAPLRASFDLE